MFCLSYLEILWEKTKALQMHQWVGRKNHWLSLLLVKLRSKTCKLIIKDFIAFIFIASISSQARILRSFQNICGEHLLAVKYKQYKQISFNFLLSNLCKKRVYSRELKTVTFPQHHPQRLQLYWFCIMTHFPDWDFN